MWHLTNNDRERTQPAMQAGANVTRIAWRLALAVTLALPPALLGPVGFAALPTAYAQQGDGVLAVVNVADAPLLTEPGGAAVGKLALGSVVTAVRRTADGQMVEVVTETGESGWVASSALVAFGLDRLPAVGEVGAQPTTPQATGTTAATVAASRATAAPPTQTPQPSPTPTDTPAPTATPKATATPTPAPTATPRPTTPPIQPSISTAQGGQLAVVGMTGATLYDAPDGAVVAQLAPADTLTVIARNADGDWLYATGGAGEKGWTATENLVVFGVDTLPVVGGTTEGADAAPASTAAEPATDLPGMDAAESATSESMSTPAANAGAADLVNAQVKAEGSRLNVRSGPGASNRVVGKAANGEMLIASGRNAASDWVRVEREDLPGGVGWVAASFVALDRAIDTLPVVDATDSVAVAPVVAVATEEVATAVVAATDVAVAAATAVATVAPVMEVSAATVTVAAPAITPAPAVKRTAPTGLAGKLAFMDGKGGIYLYELASGAVRWLTNGYDPELSPDGSRVAFTRGGNDNSIYVINVDGSGEREVFGEGEVLRAPKWSPDGQRIVFSRYAGDYRCFDTEFFGCITIAQLQAQFPQIPPSFIHKLLNGAERVAKPNFGIARVFLDGSEFRDINALDSAVAPDWNEAGIVYQSTAGLEVTEDTPEGQTKAIFQEDWDWDPDWQPNGGRVVFQSREGSHWEIWSITPDGGGIVALTRPATTLVDQLPSNVAPAWSPDGQYIVYVSNRDAENDAGPWRIWVMDADGSNQRPLPIDIPIDYTYAVEQMVSWGR